jgi:hypothetical protein
MQRRLKRLAGRTPRQAAAGPYSTTHPAELPRGFRTAELVDSSTLPRLAVDNRSGLRSAAR